MQMPGVKRAAGKGADRPQVADRARDVGLLVQHACAGTGPVVTKEGACTRWLRAQALRGGGADVGTAAGQGMRLRRCDGGASCLMRTPVSRMPCRRR